MRIAILGATSQIAKDLVLSFSEDFNKELMLFARRPDVVAAWLHANGMAGRYETAGFAGFTTDRTFDAVINFVGVGNPAQAAAMGATILDITLQYDDLVLNYLKRHPTCRYIFLSSGAAYGASFDQPVDADTKASIPLNNLQSQDWYGIAKLHAECRHRSLAHLPIVDIRIFNYFSRTQDLTARFLITDILRAVRDNEILKTSADYIVRDFLHPSDFSRLICSVLMNAPSNAVIDAYSQEPVDKPQLLAAMQSGFGLRYEFVDTINLMNATGAKAHYYSLNRGAENFGYNPQYKSLAGVLLEAECVMARSRKDTEE